jgi:CUB domain
VVESLKSPHHWLAPKSHCSYHLVAKPGKQIWLTFKTLRTRSSCLEMDDHVQVWDGHKLIGQVCRNNSLDHPLVSRSSQLKIMYISPNGTLDATSRLYFHVRFAAVSAMETGSHVQGTWCDTQFDSVEHLGGPFALLSPKDILLEQFKELGNLVCK